MFLMVQPDLQWAEGHGDGGEESEEEELLEENERDLSDVDDILSEGEICGSSTLLQAEVD